MSDAFCCKGWLGAAGCDVRLAWPELVGHVVGDG